VIAVSPQLTALHRGGTHCGSLIAEAGRSGAGFRLAWAVGVNATYRSVRTGLNARHDAKLQPGNKDAIGVRELTPGDQHTGRAVDLGAFEPRRAGSRGVRSSVRRALGPEESHQVGVNSARMCRRHAVRKPLVCLQGAVLQ
jgi:hypothetical protein